MPLDRAHVTVASRIMLPAYPLFAAGIGLSLILTPLDRLSETPAFRYVAELAPLRLWGAVFLTVAAVLVVALLVRRRPAYVLGLSLMCMWMLGWAGLLVASAIKEESSWSAWTWPLFVAVACYASLASLLSREV